MGLAYDCLTETTYNHAYHKQAEVELQEGLMAGCATTNNKSNFQGTNSFIYTAKAKILNE